MSFVFLWLVKCARMVTCLRKPSVLSWMLFVHCVGCSNNNCWRIRTDLERPFDFLQTNFSVVVASLCYKSFRVLLQFRQISTGDWWPLHQSDEDAVPRRADFYLLVVGATVWHTQTDVVSCDNFTSIAVLHEFLACCFPHLSSLPIPSSIRPC